MSVTSNPASTATGLHKADLNPNPFSQFKEWFKRVLEAQVLEPTAMTLATSTPDGIPSARIVLMKGVDDDGFVFFTNYESQKGTELQSNPRVALVFFWPTLERQVRVTGVVAKTSREESEHYFHARPVGSQIGAWASAQSQVLEKRDVLDAKVDRLTVEYQGRTIPLPPYWGGYRVRPEAFEFWQARVSRVHDRFRYTRLSSQGWKIERLSP